MESYTIGQSGGTSLQVQHDPSWRLSGDYMARHAFIANLKHELRNLLNAIIGFSEILLEEMEKSRWQGPAADLLYVNETGKQIVAVIGDVLDPCIIEQDLSEPDFQKMWGVLHYRLYMPLNNLVSRGEILYESAREAEWQSRTDDLYIIYSSAKKLQTIIEHLAFPAGKAGIRPGNSETKPNDPDAVRETEGIFRSLESMSTLPEAQRGLILLVDDDEANRGLICRWLNRDQHTIIAAENGRQAIDLLAAHDFDLVLLDVIMPEINGYQVLRHIRSTGRLQNVPVIMISAFDEAESAVRCIETGAEEYLIKPFDKNLLKARVKACLQKKIDRDKTVRELNASLNNKASRLRTVAKELGASRRKIGVLEEKTARFQSAVRQEIEKASRVSIFDILVIVGFGFILGLAFNAANPGSLRLVPLSWSAQAPSFSDIDSAKAKFDAKTALFVDARPSEYFKRGHIPGAVSLPNTLFDFIYTMKLAELDPETEIIIYGRDISRLHDEEVAFRLRSKGHRNISIMADGLSAWQKRGYPLEKRDQH